MTNENPSGESELGGAHVTPPGEDTTVSDEATLSLAELNQFLGKDFKDKETALKSLKETGSYVGKRKEDIAAEVRRELASGDTPAADAPATKSEVQSLKSELFYSNNPQYKGYEALIAKMGTDPAEVVQLPEFKSVFEKAQIADDVEAKKSVVHSSSRLAQSKSATDEAIAIANARGATGEDVALSLAKSITSELNEG